MAEILISSTCNSVQKHETSLPCKFPTSFLEGTNNVTIRVPKHRRKLLAKRYYFIARFYVSIIQNITQRKKIKNNSYVVTHTTKLQISRSNQMRISAHLEPTPLSTCHQSANQEGASSGDFVISINSSFLTQCYNPKFLVNQSDRLAIINPANTCNPCQTIENLQTAVRASYCMIFSF